MFERLRCVEQMEPYILFTLPVFLCLIILAGRGKNGVVEDDITVDNLVCMRLGQWVICVSKLQHIKESATHVPFES